MAVEPGRKVVVITGASSGIGRAAARECAEAGGDAIPVACDVTQYDDVVALAEAAKQRFGQLDVWVNDAGIHLLGRFEDLPLEDFRQIIEVNLMGTVHGCRAALPVFRAQGHCVIINVAKRHFQQSPRGRSRGNLFSPQGDAVHGGWANSSNRTAAITMAAAALVAVPLGIYAWRRMRGQSAYV